MEDGFGREKRDSPIWDLEEIVGVSLSDGQPSTRLNLSAHGALCRRYVSKWAFWSRTLRNARHRVYGKETGSVSSDTFLGHLTEL